VFAHSSVSSASTGFSWNAGVKRRLAQGALQVLLVQVMPAYDARDRIGGTVPGGEHILPAPFRMGIRKLALQREGEIDRTKAFRQGALMQ